MNDSAFEGLIVGVYVLIFLGALTSTVFLFNSIYNYSEEAYKYSKSISDKSLITGTLTEEDYINDIPKEQEIILKGDELISYYFNYIAFDSYQNQDIRDELRSGSKYKVEIGNNNVIGNNTNLTYKELLQRIDLNKEYVLKYAEIKSTGISRITVNERVVEATETGE